MSNHIEALRETAKKDPRTVVLPEGDELRTLKAASFVSSEGIAKIIIIGKPEAVRKLAAENSVSVDKTEIIDPEKYPRSEEMVEQFYELRKHKGVTMKDSREAIYGNRVYFGAMLARLDVADGFVAGANHTTSNVARAALFCVGLEDEISVMSGSFLVEFEKCPYGNNGLFIFGDCGVVPDPDPVKLADIAISTSRLYEQFFRQKPYVALLSYSTKGSARGESVDKVLKALEIIRKKAPGLMADGELQLDAAVVPEVGKIKAPTSRIAGQANVLIFPNLDSGNISYKLAQRLGNARVVGPLLQGVKKPASDVSRGCDVDEIIDAIAATVVRAQKC